LFIVTRTAPDASAACSKALAIGGHTFGHVEYCCGLAQL
jgi:hypothetical protein